MRIALDYDHTYSRDPGAWDKCIDILREAGHDVRGVTARSATEDRTLPLVKWEGKLPVIYTNGIAKESVCAYLEWEPEVWIDDKVRSIIANSTTTPDQLAEWRTKRDEGPSYPWEPRLWPR